MPVNGSRSCGKPDGRKVAPSVPAGPRAVSSRWLRSLGLAWLSLAKVVAVLHAGGLWDLETLQGPPRVEWVDGRDRVQEVYYAGERYRGEPTRIFAYLARPSGVDTGGRRPGIVLVHGGGGQAFQAWAERWAERGYVALAMDLSGNGPGKQRLPDGGPPLANQNIFLAATDAEALRDGWPYHAVAAVLRGVSLLASLPEVDPSRLGITGISWGGYLTCIVAGLDPRVKVAVPVYGSGFLHESSYWKAELLDPLTPEQRSLWARHHDPSAYLGQVACPILFVNGANDPRFYLDSHRRSAGLVRSDLRHLAVTVGLKHGHLFDLPEVDRFVDAVLKGGTLPPQFGQIEKKDDYVSVPVSETDGMARAELHHASAQGPWEKRAWTTMPATLAGGTVSAALPAERPLLVYFPSSMPGACAPRVPTP